jgi:hypothetical protein
MQCSKPTITINKKIINFYFSPLNLGETPSLLYVYTETYFEQLYDMYNVQYMKYIINPIYVRQKIANLDSFFNFDCKAYGTYVFDICMQYMSLYFV